MFAFCKLFSNRHKGISKCVFIFLSLSVHTHIHTDTVNNERAVRAHQHLSVACGGHFSGRKRPSGLPEPKAKIRGAHPMARTLSHPLNLTLLFRSILCSFSLSLFCSSSCPFLISGSECHISAESFREPSNITP